jgi:hypothetical protein
MQIPTPRVRVLFLAALAAALQGPTWADDASTSVPRSAACALPSEHWRLADEFRFYLQRPPGSLTGAYRTQGMATDGHHWFFSWQYGLEIADNHFNSILRNSSIEPPLSITPGIPSDLLAQGLNHIGDIDYHDGIIYASLDSTTGYTNGHVALYSAADLTYTGVSYPLTGAPSNPKHDIASWVAVDGHHNRGYGKEYQLGNTINIYRLSDWTFQRVLTLDMALERIQGAKAHGQWLYMSSDNATHSIYRANLRTGHVEELFRLPSPAGHLEVEGIGLSARDDDGDPDIYVEMVVDPDNSGTDLSNPDIHVSLFHYRPERGRE